MLYVPSLMGFFVAALYLGSSKLISFRIWGSRLSFSDRKLIYHVAKMAEEFYKVGPPNDSVQLVQITPITMVYGCSWYL